MSRHFSSVTSTFSIPDDLDVQKLHDAQQCLRCRERHQIPTDGEEQAWEWFYKTYDPLLRRWVLGCHVPLDDLGDCAQDVWTEVVSNLPAFASDGSQGRLCSWLYAIAHSKGINFLRHRLGHPAKRLSPKAETALPSRDADPVSCYEQHRREEAVQHVLALLRRQVSATSYRVFWLRSIEERAIPEVAAELQLTPAQVRCRFHRTKQRFRLLWEALTRADTSKER